MATSMLDFLNYDLSNTQLADAVKHARQTKANKAKWSQVAKQVDDCVHNCFVLGLRARCHTEFIITNDFAQSESYKDGFNPDGSPSGYEIHLKSMDCWVCYDYYMDNVYKWKEYEEEGFDCSYTYHMPGKIGHIGRLLKDINENYKGTYLEVEW